MADRLTIYREAARLLGDQRIASLTEDNSTRKAFDDAWRPTVDWLLARGLWNFALRTVELSQDDDVEPLFGRTYAFAKPDDWVRTGRVSNDGTFRTPFNDFDDETNYWYADIDPFYVQYVSDDDAWGWNVGEWRQPFAKAVAARLAFDCGLPVSGDKSNRNDMETLAEKRLREAKTLDAVDERVQQTAPGRLVQSRGGRMSRENG